MSVHNVILCDFIPCDKWEFLEELEKETQQNWRILPIENNFKKKYERIFDYFVFPMKLILGRNEIGSILSWQQFFGIVFAFYSRILHLKKKNSLTIMTFIYKPKKGIIGKVYLTFIKYAICSKYVDDIICFSSHECNFYKSIFFRKFNWARLGVEDRAEEFEEIGKKLSDKEHYYLAVGRSNRDYDFLIKAFKKAPYKLVIICDILKIESKGNIIIYNDVKGDAYYQMLAGCYAVIIPLKDENVSSGQLSLIEASMMSKPIICTRTYGIKDYLEDNKGCIPISNTSIELRKAIKMLENPNVYRNMSHEARRAYEEYFSMKQMADEIADILNRNYSWR